jgi:hypothetical protein
MPPIDIEIIGAVLPQPGVGRAWTKQRGQPGLKQHGTCVEPQLREGSRGPGLQRGVRAVAGDGKIDGVCARGREAKKRDGDEKSLSKHPPLCRPVAAAREKAGHDGACTDAHEDDGQEQREHGTKSAEEN